MEHGTPVHEALRALEAQLATLKSLLGQGSVPAEPEEESEESAEASPPPHESSRARRVRHRDKASRLIRGELAKGKETDYALD